MNKKLEFNKLKSYPLGNDDLMEIVDLEPSNIFSSDKLLKVDNIDELLDRKGRGILLWLTENENTGHWISLLRKGNTIEIFDPYGNLPKDWTKKLNSNKGLNPPSDLLEKLIKRSGYKIKINTMKHQDINNSNIATCGRHSALRLLYNHLNLDEYNNFMKDIKKKYNINPDELTTAFTYEIINK